MIKTVDAFGWDFDGQLVVPVKVARAGLAGADFAALVKRAGHPLADWVRREADVRPGELLVHNIALGSTERYGPNRNADGYKRAMLERDSATFVGAAGGKPPAHWFRDHVNQDPKRSYGVVKRAWFNPEMERTELIVALNATKEAAARNGGLVADRELDLLESGRDIPTSQSCKVSHDVCMSCGNEAKTRAYYCGPTQCKYGGCRDNLGRVFDDGFVLYVDNPNCSFFDISYVKRGADRTSFLTGKVANTGLGGPGGAAVAEALGLTFPEHAMGGRGYAALKAARELVRVEAGYAAVPPVSWADRLAARGAAAVPLPGKEAADYARHAFLAEAAADGLVLPPADWLAACTGAPRSKCAAAFAGPGLTYRDDLLGRRDATELLADGLSAPHIRISPANAYAGYAPTAEAVERAAWKAASAPIFQADAPNPYRHELAARYLAYQAAAVSVHANSANFHLLRDEALRHNRFPTS